MAAESALTKCLFVSDLHGCAARYGKLWAAIRAERPVGVFLGGDLLGSAARVAAGAPPDEFVAREIGPALRALRVELGPMYPRIFTILGNDDPALCEPAVVALAVEGLWTYVHGRCATLEAWTVYGYACVPPTPFALKDWERYDVSRYVDPGCVSPEDGVRSVPCALEEVRFGTIANDLEHLCGSADLTRSILLCHAPPHATVLDRAALDGRMIDHVPVDVHVGSIALRRFIEQRQPWITLHGHIHESARLTGHWRETLLQTHCYSAAHDGPELACVWFDPADRAAAHRELR